jgi:hypothetical protein
MANEPRTIKGPCFDCDVRSCWCGWGDNDECACHSPMGERTAPIIVGSSAVGYEIKTSRTPLDSALASVRKTWKTAGGDDAGLLSALKPTMAMLSAVAKKLYPDSKEDQEAKVAEWSVPKTSKEFGVFALPILTE